MGWRARIRLAACVALLAGCGGDRPGTSTETTPAEPWGAEAEALFDSILDGLQADDHTPFVRLLSAGGSFDARAVGGDVMAEPARIAQIVQSTWFMQPHHRDDKVVQSEHLFLGQHSALQGWSGGIEGRTLRAMQFFEISGPTVASRLYADWSPTISDETFDIATRLYDDFTALWSGEPDSAVEAVYAEAAIIRDAITDEVVRGHPAIEDMIADSAPLSDGPTPQVYLFQANDQIEVVAIVHRMGACPMLEAHRWMVEAGQIVDDTRFLHPPSVRRCSVEVDDGWWVDFELPAEYRGTVSRWLETEHGTVELGNARPGHSSLAAYLFDRFENAGLDAPDVAAVWFPPSPDCTGYGGMAREVDVLHDGRHSVVICFRSDQIYSPDRSYGWAPGAVNYGLHEFAHVWLYDRADAALEQDFLDRLGLDTWSDHSVPRELRGVEHAASTIGWGVAGTEYARYSESPVPSCEELAIRYELLTGRWPTTACEGAGQ